MSEPRRSRLSVSVRGCVQGVGFRPFVYRLATALALDGWVANNSWGVQVEVEGAVATLREFLLRLDREKPPRASIQSLESTWLDPRGYQGFEIRSSQRGGEAGAIVLPDIATCADCLRETLDPADRRYRYPFTNCTNCGPRFSIIESLPYDRPNTSMKSFEMCAACRREYEDPADRRFHAQPNACPVCGPHVELWGVSGEVRDEALRCVVRAIRDGAIIAVKGLGGFHLLADARSEEAVRELRRRKRREEKPFAVMCPTIEAAGAECEIGSIEARLLTSPEAPIVLVARRSRSSLCDAIAPGNPNLGVMLPSNPLHHLLMSDLGSPVIATSGNLSEEPICTDEREARDRLAGIADLFLVHNRPIVRHVDDSIVRVAAGRELVLRRARGYAPLPRPLPGPVPPGAISVGAHLKNTVAVSVAGQACLSQHIGDLESAQAFDAHRRVLGDLARLHGVRPRIVACDLHPDYLSTAHARSLGIDVVPVQHHYAHVRSCMADNEITGSCLGVAWDGTGFGPDGTIWGGEFLAVSERSFERFAHLRCFLLPGGDRAAREPRRSAAGLLHEILREGWTEAIDLKFEPDELAGLRSMLAARVNCPLTSSAGRLFDAVSAILGLRHVNSYEGQAAMALEFAIGGAEAEESYEIGIADGTPLIVDWEPMLRAILKEATTCTPAVVSMRFHNALADCIVAIARRANEPRVVLSGGCFQNRYLLERTLLRLCAAGFQPYWHQRVPPNDGGIALGQLAALAALRSGGEHER